MVAAQVGFTASFPLAQPVAKLHFRLLLVCVQPRPTLSLVDKLGVSYLSAIKKSGPGDESEIKHKISNIKSDNDQEWESHRKGQKLDLESNREENAQDPHGRHDRG